MRHMGRGLGRGDNMLDKVKVAGVTYTIETPDEIGDEPDNLGNCIYQKQLIRVKANMSQERREQTFIHELLHAIFFEAGYTDSDYEEMVNRLSLVLYQVLKDNPKLLHRMQRTRRVLDER